MIERITGTVAAKAADHVVVDVGGVGFLLDASAVTLRDVAAVGEQTVLFTHLHVREDVLQLYGFSSEEERELFRLFLGVSKIGPKIALAALSCRRAPDLKKALGAGDVALFASVPGIGKKTAERLILELRERMGEAGLGGGPGASGGAPIEEGSIPLARAALVELGYSVLEADKLLSPLDAELPVEELIREALTKRV
ncbi:MAG: Holliday junction branch migration protein RuvA [Thermoleophilia bacterium]|nr:Holliday junction branch migration protein RuvA [Thermoleophilia bacterium]